MALEAISGYGTHLLQQNVAVSMLKKSMDFQQQAVLKLMQSLPELKDPALGNNIDTYA